jgi:Fn3 associated/Chitobiase/beta-hexosaminidase C-terminal domain
LCLFALAAHSLGAQVLSLSSATVSAGGSASLNLALTSGGNSMTSLQWTIQYPATGVSSISAVAGPALTAAGKSLNCSANSGAYTCIAFGMNATTIPDGVIATVASTTSQTTPLGVVNTIAASATGGAIPVSGSGGTVTVTTSPTTAAPTAAAPVFSPPPGSYTQPVTISAATPGATIRYTLNGSTPTETNGTVYAGPISLTAATTIKAIAYETGYTDSAVSSGAYTFASPGTDPSLVQSFATESAAPGNSSQSAAFQSGLTAGNTIFVFAQYYGPATTATASDNCGDVFQEITGSPAVNTAGDHGAAHWFAAKNVAGGACTVKVAYSAPTNYGGLAVFEVSGLGGANLTLDRYASGSGTGNTASATLTPSQASSFAIAQVWSDGGGGSSLGGNWTTQEKTRFSTLYQNNLAGWQALNSPAAVPVSVPVGPGPWIVMIANFYAAGGTGSQVATPTFSPAPGPYTQPITISTTTPGATIRYTTDGSTPTSSTGAIYTSPVAVSVTSTVKAIAYESGASDSSVASGIYTFSNGTVATPTFSPLPGPYTQPVTIGATTPGATIRYTLDGTTPTETNGTVYTGAISLTATTTIKAIAYESGYPDSAVSSGSYTFASTSPGTGASLVQSFATESLLPGNSGQSVAFQSRLTAGNTIFVFAQYYGPATTVTASDSCGDVFQEITGSPAVNTGGDRGAAHWFMAKNVAGGMCAVKVGYAAPTNYGGLAVFEVSGLGANVTLDRYATGSGSGNTASATLTPSHSSSFAIAQVWSDGGGGTSLGGNWTTQERTRFSTLYQNNLAGWQVLGSTAAVPVSVPVESGPWIVMIANFYAQ